VTLTEALWYLITAACVIGIGRESLLSYRKREFTSASAGWMMVYLGTAALALQPVLAPTAAMPAAARAYNNGGSAVVGIGLAMALAAKFLRKRDQPSDIRSIRS
jgi:purine-cytosine permease-like protein